MHRSRALALVVSSLLALPLGLAAQDGPAVADAPLRAMWMADAREGWAAGDDGLILHTVDGWETFERQTTHVRASLRGVHFVDPYLGYAVGLEVLPFGRGTAGVVLGTTDGGATWNKLVNREMPGLNAVCFLNADQGFAFGDTTGGCASGVFMTTNRGKTWDTVPALSATNGWTCGTMHQGAPLFGGARGQVGTIEKEQVFVLPTRLPRDMVLQAMAAKDHDVWAVGTQATVLVSRKTAGKNWEAVELPMPGHLRGSLDFNSVCCQGDHVWIAGRPGSVVFHSWDRGKSWEAQRTGQAFPLNHLCFADEKTGWAVGECGTILQTKDGGRSWAVRRRGGHRSGLMFVTAQASRHQTASGHQLPLGTMAVFGGDQGYLTTAVQVTYRPDEYRADGDRLRQAARTVGGSSAEVLSGFPLADYQESTPAELLRQVLDEKRLEEQLVLALRTWRPSVVVGDDPSEIVSQGRASQVISTALRRACELSGKADAYPEHFTKFDLQPWQPVRLFCRSGRGATVAAVVDLDLPRPTLFAAANDFANLARPMLFDRFPPARGKEEFTLVHSWGEAVDVSSDLMAGLSLGHGGQARREKVNVDDLRYQLLLAATKQQWDNTQTARAKLADPVEEKHFFTNFEASLVGLAPMTIGDRIFAKAQEFADQGQWTMARECHLMLLDLMPTHRLAAESCRFILTTMGSSEARRRVDLKQMKTMAEYAIRSPFSLTDREGRVNLDPKAQKSVVQRRRGELRRWNAGAVAAGEILSVVDPLCFADPATQFCLQANRRAEGRDEASRLWQTNYQLRQPPGPWFDAAAAELWLAQPVGAAPKPFLQVKRIAAPQIDGSLDDAIWKDVPAMMLRPAAGKTARTEVRMAYDDQYLYLAVRCQAAEGVPLLAAVKPRKRDDDLGSFDRVSLMLDLDRDYNTYFHFEFDQRGCVAEDCCGDLTWNPKWFVEVQSARDGWTAEVAIPLVELTGKENLAGETWACNVTRITPGVGVQAASLPSGVQPRCEGMGLLRFEEGVVKQAGK